MRAMRFDPQTAASRDVYFTMIRLIVPRPIAWISTLSSEGVPNLAPFSFFTGVTSRPPTLAVCVGNKRGGVPKDTARNAIDTGELVVNIVPTSLAEPMVLTSGDYSPETDEIALAGLETLASERVAPPRVAGTPAQLECTLHQVVEIKDERDRVTNRMLIARIELVHVADEVIDSEGRIDPRRLDPLARLGGDDYASLGALREVARPKR